jgi:predicted transcriptional regulator
MAIESNVQRQRQQAHELLDLLSPAKIGAMRNLLEQIVEEEEDAADLAAIRAGVDSLDSGRWYSMEEVLAEFGLTMADFEKMAAEPDSPKNG